MLLGACSDEITEPPPPAAGTMTVEAVAEYAFADLASGEEVEPSADPSSSPDWDLAFLATTVSLNGGEAGPAGVVGYCICQNAESTNEQVLALTADSELADFEAVTASDIPAASAWSSDALTPAITGWATGTGAEATLVAGKFWKMRLNDGTSFAKVRVVEIENPTATHAGTVTLEYALQPTETSAFGSLETVTVNLAGGPVSVDLNAGTTVTTAAWDLRLDGYTIRVNSGVSGAGLAGAATPAAGETFETLTTAVTDASAYRADRYAGVFGSSPWYRYNITGNHRIHPTYDVYLIKRGQAVYKLQLLDYYGPAGQPRHITFRYEQIAG